MGRFARLEYFAGACSSDGVAGGTFYSDISRRHPGTEIYRRSEALEVIEKEFAYSRSKGKGYIQKLGWSIVPKLPAEALKKFMTRSPLCSEERILLESCGHGDIIFSLEFKIPNFSKKDLPKLLDLLSKMPKRETIFRDGWDDESVRKFFLRKIKFGSSKHYSCEIPFYV